MTIHIGKAATCKFQQILSARSCTHDSPDMHALGPAALDLQAYISDKSLTAMFTTITLTLLFFPISPNW